MQAVDTLIGDITPPEALMKTQTDRKIAEEEKKTYEIQEEAQKQRQLLVRETAVADIQQQVVASEQGVMIAELNANATIKAATGESESIRLRALGQAEAIRATGFAQAEAYRAGVEALGAPSFAVAAVDAGHWRAWRPHRAGRVRHGRRCGLGPSRGAARHHAEGPRSSGDFAY